MINNGWCFVCRRRKGFEVDGSLPKLIWSEVKNCPENLSHSRKKKSEDLKRKKCREGTSVDGDTSILVYLCH